jgi:hypothetical protein
MTRLKFKRHYKLLLLLALLVAGLVVGMGDQPIVAYSVRATEQAEGPITTYSHTLATPVAATADSIWLPETAQGSSAADSQ